MIQVKLLRLKDVKPVGVDNLPQFLEGIRNVIGKDIEIAEKIDPNFEGYYLLPMGFTIPEDGNGKVKENINEKVFLLSVINTNIPRILEECNPAGLNNWVLFKDAGTSVIGNDKALRKAGYSDSDFGFIYNKYKSIVPIESDGSYETAARSILKYLEIYNRYLKSK